MRKLPYLLFILFFQTTLSHSAGSLVGKVVDARDSSIPVQRFDVDLLDPITGNVTGDMAVSVNQGGFYRIDNIPPGDYKVIFNSAGVSATYQDELYNGIVCPDGACDRMLLGDIVTIAEGENTLNESLVNTVSEPTGGTNTVNVAPTSTNGFKLAGALLLLLGDTDGSDDGSGDGALTVGPIAGGIANGFVFNAEVPGTILYGGSCGDGTLVNANVGVNSFSFRSIPSSSQGELSDCTVSILDSDGNLSNVVVIPPFFYIRGKLINPLVSGVRYEAVSYSGVVDSDNEFSFAPGEAISFYLGNLYLGQAKGKELVSVVDFTTGFFDSSNLRLVNILSTLYSLDADCDADNNVQLDSNIINLIETLQIDFDSINFENNELSNAINAIGCNDGLVSATTALGLYSNFLHTNYYAVADNFDEVTLLGDEEPSVAFDIYGNQMFIVNDELDEGEQYKILYSQADDNIYTASVGNDGLIDNVKFADGRMLTFDFVSYTQVDVALVSLPLDESSPAVIESFDRIELDELGQKLVEHLFSKSIELVNEDQSVPIGGANALQQKSQPASITSSLIGENIDDKPIDFADGAINLVVGQNIARQIGPEHAKGFGKAIIVNAVEDHVVEGAMNKLGISKSYQDVISAGRDAFGCLPFGNLYSALVDCVNTVVQSRKDVAQLFRIYRANQRDKERIAAMELILAEMAKNFGEFPPQVKILSPESFIKVAPNTSFTATSQSIDPDKNPLQTAWFFNDVQIGIGTSVTYDHPFVGVFELKAVTIDSTGRTGSATKSIEIGNERPAITITNPSTDGVSLSCDRLPFLFSAEAFDLEDGQISDGFVWQASSRGTVGASTSNAVLIDFPCPAANAFQGQEPHYVSVEITDEGGASASAFVNFNVTLPSDEEEATDFSGDYFTSGNVIFNSCPFPEALGNIVNVSKDDTTNQYFFTSPGILNGLPLTYRRQNDSLKSTGVVNIDNNTQANVTVYIFDNGVMKGESKFSFALGSFFCSRIFEINGTKQ